MDNNYHFFRNLIIEYQNGEVDMSEEEIMQMLDEAYEEVAAFLCTNDINHTFIVNRPNERFGVRLVSVCWKGAMGEENLGWWELVK